MAALTSSENQAIRILHLEDNPLDAELIRGTLEQEWPDCVIHRVETREDFVAGLHDERFDLVLSDFSLPKFNGLAALELTRQHNAIVPFIFLSGSIGEDNAVAALQHGATDYVLKDRQVRLIPAIRRALVEKQERRQREQAEALLRESQDRFLKLAEQSRDVFWFVKADPEQFQYVSPAFEQLWGFPVDQLYQDTGAWDRGIHPDDRRRVKTAFAACLSGRTASFEQEYRVVRPDGSERWVLDNGIAIRGADQRLVRISGIAKDITDRKIAEQHIREQADLIDKAHEAIYLRDLDDRIFHWNKSAERIFGYGKDEVFGQRITELQLRLSHPEKFAEAKRILLEKGEWTGEFHIVNRRDQELDLQASWTLVRDDQGVAKSILCIDMDVTAQRALEKQFLRAQRQESMGTLAGGIAHDLNNMLAPISMAIELLKSRIKDAELQRFLTVLQNSALHGAGLVRQVLTFSRGTEGERVDIEPGVVIKEVVTLLHETLPRSITLETEVPHGLHHVLSNSTELGQVLMNLCVNARDAMPEGGRILIQARNSRIDDMLAQGHPWAQPGPCVQIRVTDTGSGIPLAIIERIFDPFFTTKKIGKGTGLGLSTVLGIVKSHHGILQVHSKPGEGATFVIYLPAEIATPSKTLPPANAAALPHKQTQTILIIDDEESVRIIARAVLESSGYNVIEAETGRAGIDLYRQHRDEVNGVLTDMMMPSMQGPEVIHKLRGIDSDVGIVAMSGMLTENPDLKEEPGKLAFLQKPMTAQQLLQAVRSVVPSESPHS